MNERRVPILALLLMAVAAAGIYAKVAHHGLPLTADDQTAVWTVEARLSFVGRGKVKARLALPPRNAGLEVLDEDFVSRGFGLTEEVVEGQRYALWTVRSADGPEALYYRLTLNPRSGPAPAADEFPGYPKVPAYPELYAPAIQTLLGDARSHSADIASFAQRLIQKLRADQSDPAVALLRDEARTPEEQARQLVYLLAGARIPARVVYGLQLKHGLLDAQLQPWLQVHNEQNWLSFDPRTGVQGLPHNFLLWQLRPGPSLNIEGGRKADLRFSVRRGEYRTLDLARTGATGLAQLSLLGLPLHVQNVYSVLLMVPFGALLVVFLRNLVGIRTFGTFMPVLIALAFRETELLWGTILFTAVVSAGLALRFALEHLKLLLVPRLAAVLTMVIGLMLLLSLLSHQVGFERGLSVALFPMVILAMTIERMSIVWEEHGPQDAIVQGLGSLLVAVLAFLIMNLDALQHLVGLFPEILLIVLAIMLLLGRYTGYRLSELWRFRAFWLKRE